MNKEMLEDVYQLLGSYWYDREDDDIAIVNEFVRENPPQVVERYINSVKQFIDLPEPIQVKSDFVRKTAWRYFPQDVEAPIKWLKDILSLLEKSSIDQGKET